MRSYTQWVSEAEQDKNFSNFVFIQKAKIQGEWELLQIASLCTICQ